MQFDPSHKPSQDNLSTESSSFADNTFFARTGTGLNTQFVRWKSRMLDECPPKHCDQTENFSRRLPSNSIDHASSA